MVHLFSSSYQRRSGHDERSGADRRRADGAHRRRRHPGPVDAPLAHFSHLWPLTWLHRPGQPIDDGASLRQVPYLLGPGGAAKGIFATRGLRRPNPIGPHLVRLVEVVEVVEDPPDEDRCRGRTARAGYAHGVTRPSAAVLGLLVREPSHGLAVASPKPWQC